MKLDILVSVDGHIDEAQKIEHCISLAEIPLEFYSFEEDTLDEKFSAEISFDSAKELKTFAECLEKELKDESG